MRSIRNSVQLIGRLGKDPEVRNLDNGRMVANFSLATTEKYKDKEGRKVEETQWHNVVVWGKLAEIVAKYVTKGQEIAVEGKLTHRSWDHEGQKRYTTEIVVNDLVMLGGKKQNNGNGQQASSAPPDDMEPAETSDSLFGDEKPAATGAKRKK